MIELQDTLISEDILEKQFVCNLSACKGACCVEGDAGAPLLEEELPQLEQAYEAVKPYMRKEGIAAVEKQGLYVNDDWDKEKVTPLVNDKECAFVAFDDDGTAKCTIEQAYRDGKTTFYKPISCHLYPIRIKQYSEFKAINYHKWDICSAACSLGENLKVKVYQFLKEPLIRAFGEDWYTELEAVDEAWQKHAQN